MTNILAVSDRRSNGLGLGRRRHAIAACFLIALVPFASAGVAADQRREAPEAAPTTSLDRIRGVLVPRRQATISASQTATITRIGPETGERFVKGTVLVAFDCGIYSAELKRAQALAEAATDTLEVRRALAAGGSVAKLQVQLAEAETKKAKADVYVAEERVSYCLIRAPFDGRVVRRIANAHETVAQRDPLIEIVDDGSIELRAFVPSHWLARVAAGTGLAIDLDETGGRLEARVITPGANIDNVSQLLEIRAEIVGPYPGVLAGMSGRISFQDRQTEARRP